MTSAKPMRFLKHIETGQVLAWTEILAAHKQMRPYEMPVKEQEKQTVVAVSFPGDDEYDPANRMDGLAVPDPTIMDKDEAAALVHKLFGRDHTRVTLAELAEYAKTVLGVEIAQSKKLTMASEIAAIIKDREE